jgi:plastocyanin
MPEATQFQIVVGVIGSLVCTLCALAYFRHVRLPRPPIGTFNGRDLTVLACFIVTLPLLYVALPAGVLTGFLVLTFFSALMIALRPLASARWLLIAVPALLTANLAVTKAMGDLAAGLQIYWILTSLIVVIAAVGVANLYVQGGLQLRQIAWFTVFLGVYDIVFTRFIPLTPELAVALQGRPLDPSVGFASGGYNANVGLGDLLVFCLYATAAYRGFGRRGAVVALVAIVLFGAIAPSVTPLLVPGLFGTTAAAFVPVMTLFAPAAVVGYLLLSRTASERSVLHWLAERSMPARRPGAARVGMALPTLAVAVLAMATVALSGDTTPTNAAAAPPAAASRPAAGERVAVEMRNVAFGPRALTVKVGQTIVWSNEDRVPHDVVATSGATFDSGHLDAGGTFAYRAKAAGTIEYVCTLHQGMDGTIVVRR